MAKKVENIVKLQIPAGKATPAPPVGPALGQAGINIMGFTKEFNARTADQAGMIIPVVISVYEDKSFDFVIKTAPVAGLLLKEAGIKKGSSNAKTTKVGHISQAQLRKIAEYKLPDLNCNDVEAAMKIVAGSARNMGIVIDEK